MKKVFIVSLIGILICAFSVVVSGSAYAEKEVRIGLLSALSGPASPWGIPNARVRVMDAERINENGGFKIGGTTYKWKTFVYDHKYIPAEAVKALNRAIFQDRCNFISIQGGAPAAACIPLLKQNNIISLNDDAGGKTVTNPNNPLVFRHNPSVEAYYLVSLKHIIEKHGVKRVASINPDDETGRAGGSAAFEWVVKAANLPLERVANEFFERGTKDFMPVLTRILAKKPDLIETGITDPVSQALVLKQARELGYKGHMLLIWGPNDEQVVSIAGAMAEGAYLGVSGPREPSTDAAKELYQRFLKKFPEREWDANYYTHSALVTCLTQAIEKAQSLDNDKLVGALENLEWQGVFGTHRWGGTQLFGIKRQMLSPVTLMTIKDGKAVLETQQEVPRGILD
ncbi:MAG: ABC transporter substrate-binding protein [Syntrophales bacterium]|jgi:branched-chain amino acid transport system substrate-binding protein|nr:ABC transporter substrate-binding protein [Syntrophales bacterium]